MHGECHLPHKEKTPSEGKKKTAVACSLCAGVDVLSLSLGLVQWKKKCRLSCMSAAVSCWKEGRDGRPTFPGLSLDSAGHPLSRVAAGLCFLRGWESSPFSAEGGQPSCTHCTHCACTERESCLPGGGGFCTRTRTPAHTRTHAWTQRPAP